MKIPIRLQPLHIKKFGVVCGSLFTFGLFFGFIGFPSLLKHMIKKVKTHTATSNYNNGQNITKSGYSGGTLLPINRKVSTRTSIFPTVVNL